MVPFQLYILGSLIFYGYESLGWAISLVLNLIIFPFIFLLILDNFIEKLDLTFLFDFLKKGILIIAVYGIFLFFFKLITHNWIEIPYLTVNAADYHKLDDKYIDRGGGIFKLISTFNNGNIYGISMLLLLPLYDLVEKSKIFKFIVKSSLIFTLSRTVWIGLFLYEFFFKAYIFNIYKKPIRNLIVIIASISLLMLIPVLMVGNNFELFDKNLGGRLGQLSVLNDMHIFTNNEFRGINEIVYLSIMREFGLFGLLLYLVGILSIICFSYSSKNVYKRSIVAGLSIYLIISLSDGALLFIPVMLYFWFLTSLMQRGDLAFSK